MDYSKHTGTHPTLGCVDHISFQPIGNTLLADVEPIAQRFCKTIHEDLNIPIFCYGSANMRNKNKISLTDKTEKIEAQQLRVIRKELGYFDSCEGDMPLHSMRLAKLIASKQVPLTPDYGDLEAFDPKKGVMCVGAVPYVQNFNIKYLPIAPKALVSQVTKYVRRDDVESLTLLHSEGGYEVACNLKNTNSGTLPAPLFEEVHTSHIIYTKHTIHTTHTIYIIHTIHTYTHYTP